MGTPAKPRRHGALLSLGISYEAGLQLANVSVVLPFILASEGAVWAAGLLYPAFSIGLILGHAVSPATFERLRHVKHLVAAGAAVAMGLLVLLATVAARVEIVVALVFLLTAFGFGVMTAISDVAYSEIIASKLPAAKRPSMVLVHGAFGAVVAIFTTLLIVPLLEDRDPENVHLDVLLIGAAALVAAGLSAIFVGPLQNTGDTVPAPSRSNRETYADGWRVARTEPWFRRYVITQLLFVPVTLGTTFYALHSAD